MIQIDKKAATLWWNANKSLLNYKSFVQAKREPFRLSYLDLLYISNFKGGNASIHEDEQEVNKRLVAYTISLEKINDLFHSKSLVTIDKKETNQLTDLANKFIALTEDPLTCIYGFKASYASALLHVYFPNLIPILDRRVLTALGLGKLNKSKNQVVNIHEHMSELIETFQRAARGSGKSIRELDQQYFVRTLYTPLDVDPKIRK